MNVARLLMNVSRFTRVFELSVGAQFDLVAADALHTGSPMVGVSAVDIFHSAFLRDRKLTPRFAPR